MATLHSFSSYQELKSSNNTTDKQDGKSRKNQREDEIIGFFESLQDKSKNKLNKQTNQKP